jgi:hypothetical protein
MSRVTVRKPVDYRHIAHSGALGGDLQMLAELEAGRGRFGQLSAGVGMGAAFDGQVVDGSWPTADVVFHSDWSTATGTTQEAVLDEDKAPLDWDNIGGGGSTSGPIAATGFAFPATMANVFRVNGDYSGNPAQYIYTRQVQMPRGHAYWPVPGVGESLFYRIYKRVVYDPTTLEDLGNNNHCIEEGPGGGGNWSWAFHVTGSLGWQPRWQWFNPAGTRYVLVDGGGSTVYLARNATYRLEWQIHRISTTQCNVHIRIYDTDDTTLLYDDSDFKNSANATRLSDNPALTFADVSLINGIQVGTNGPSTTIDPGGSIGAMWYLGGMCIRTQDWNGHYRNGA